MSAAEEPQEDDLPLERFDERDETRLADYFTRNPKRLAELLDAIVSVNRRRGLRMDDVWSRKDREALMSAAFWLAGDYD